MSNNSTVNTATNNIPVPNKIFAGTCSCIVIGGNTGDEFIDTRKHGGDGTIAQAVGPSKNAAWLGDDAYETERMVAGRANGTFPEEYIGAESRIRLDTGHDYEEPVYLTAAVKLMQERWKDAKMRHNGTIMAVREHCEVIIHPTPNEEYRNSAYPDFACHIDCFIQVVKGQIVLNPNYVIGGKENNYKIIPAAEDHWYVGDSKTCQHAFSPNWAERDDDGIPVGGMKYGIAPTHYRQQMLGYLGILAPLRKFEGAMLLASKSDNLSEEGHAQVFIPFDTQAQAEAEAILDEVMAKNRASYNGYVPAVCECKDVARAIAELPLQFPDVNIDKKPVELDVSKRKVSVDRIIECKLKIAEIDEQLKPIKEKVKEMVKDLFPPDANGEGGDELAGSVSINTKTKKALGAEADKILLSLLEDVQDAPAATFKDPDTGIISQFDCSTSLSMTKATEAALKEDYPEVYEDLLKRFPDRKPKIKDPRLEKSKKKKSK